MLIPAVIYAVKALITPTPLPSEESRINDEGLLMVSGIRPLFAPYTAAINGAGCTVIYPVIHTVIMEANFSNLIGSLIVLTVSDPLTLSLGKL